MKEPKKTPEKVVEKMFGFELTVDESLNKYKSPEFDPPKLKKIREKFSAHTNRFIFSVIRVNIYLCILILVHGCKSK